MDEAHPWVTSVDFATAHELAKTSDLPRRAVEAFLTQRRSAVWFAHLGDCVWPLTSARDAREFVCVLRWDALDNSEMDAEVLGAFFRKWTGDEAWARMDEFRAEVNEMGELGVFGIERDAVSVVKRVIRLTSV